MFMHVGAGSTLLMEHQEDFYPEEVARRGLAAGSLMVLNCLVLMVGILFEAAKGKRDTRT